LLYSIVKTAGPTVAAARNPFWLGGPPLFDDLNPYAPMNDLNRHELEMRADDQHLPSNPSVDAQNPVGEF
jgi:hypothetical protein